MSDIGNASHNVSTIKSDADVLTVKAADVVDVHDVDWGHKNGNRCDVLIDRDKLQDELSSSDYLVKDGPDINKEGDKGDSNLSHRYNGQSCGPLEEKQPEDRSNNLKIDLTSTKATIGNADVDIENRTNGHNNEEQREEKRSRNDDPKTSIAPLPNDESIENNKEKPSVITNTLTEDKEVCSEAQSAGAERMTNSEQDSKDVKQNMEGDIVDQSNNSDGSDKKTLGLLSNGSEIEAEALRQLEEIANSINFEENESSSSKDIPLEIANSINFEENESSSSKDIPLTDEINKGPKRLREDDEEDYKGLTKRMRMGDDMLSGEKEMSKLRENATPSADLTSPSKIECTETKARKIEGKAEAPKSNSLSREKLESLVLDLVSEALLSRSELSSLRRRCDAKERQVDVWKEKYCSLKKQLDDLERVLKKYKSDLAKDEKARPVILTRSVALQVDTTKQRQVVAKASTSPSMMKKKTALPELRPKRTVVATPEVVASLMTMKRPLLPYPRATHTIALPLSPMANGPTQPTTVQPLATKGIRLQQPSTNSDSLAVHVSQGTPPVPHLQQNAAQSSSYPSKQTSLASASSSSSTSSKKPEVVDLCDDDIEVKIVSSSSNLSLSSSVTVAKKRQAQMNGNVGVSSNSIARPLHKAGNSKQDTINSTIVKQSSGSSRPAHLPQSPAPMSAKVLTAGQVPPSPMPSLPPLPPPATSAASTTTGLRPVPPPADLSLSLVASGIQLKWNVQGYSDSSMHARITSFEIYALESTQPNGSAVEQEWLHVGDVEAMALPMACTLSQFVSGMKYFFAIRGCDEHDRRTTPSEVKAITLKQ